MILFCWLRGVWWSVSSFLRGRNMIPFSGHVDVDNEIHENVTIYLSRCEDCGKKDFTWAKSGSMIDTMMQRNIRADHRDVGIGEEK